MAFLPLFPLNIVAFPGEQLNLHIFEPRYRQLIAECRDAGTHFGIPCVMDGKLGEIGTEMRLKAIEKTYPEGEMDVRSEGLRRFRIRSFQRQVPGRLYGGGEVDYLPDDLSGDPLLALQLIGQIRELFDLLGLDKTLPEDPAAFRSYDWGHYIGLSLAQSYALLATPDEAARLRFMSEHLEQLIPTMQEMERLRARVRLNGHFKNLEPPFF